MYYFAISGARLVVDVSDGKCHSFPVDFMDRASSIKLNGLCVKVYGYSFCDEGSNPLVIRDGDKEAVNLEGGRFDDNIRSVKLCDDKANSLLP